MNSDIESLQTAVFGCEEHREPGLKKDVADIKLELNGNGSLGIKQKVTVMWRMHVWVLCSLSMLGGVAGTMIVQKLVQVLYSK